MITNIEIAFQLLFPLNDPLDIHFQKKFATKVVLKSFLMTNPPLL